MGCLGGFGGTVQDSLRQAQDTGFLDKLPELYHLVLEPIGFKGLGTKPQRQCCAVSTQEADLAQDEHDGKIL